MRFLCSLALLVCVLTGCASRPHRPLANSHNPSVIEVRFVGTPEYPELAERARALGNDFYPRIWAALNDSSREAPFFKIVFRKDLAQDRRFKRSAWNNRKLTHSAGALIGGNVYVNTATVLEDPAALEFILLHEMAHVAQRYGWYRRVTVPSHWREGIADAMVFKLDANLPKDRPCKCSAVWPHYLSGYTCTAAFLLYLEKAYDPQLIVRLNGALRDGSDSDDFFYKSTGRTLDQLWSEFLQTSSTTPMAVEINRLYNELGYRRGKPPRDVKSRLKAYLAKQPNGDDVIRLVDWADEVQSLLAESVYFTGVGGSVIAAMNLVTQNRLPGISKDDAHTIRAVPSMFDIDFQEQESSPEIRVRKERDSSTYHYRFIRASRKGAWTLDKAWRTDERGTVVEQYSIERD